jgi:hypothetical protein
MTVHRQTILMTSPTETGFLKASQPRPDREIDLLEHLVQKIFDSGIIIDLVDVVNVYVTFKSTARVLIKGPAERGKLKFVRALAQSIIGEDNQQLQMMVAHPYWASGSQNVAFFTEAHARFNTGKVLALIEEAWQPENRWRVFISCLANVSPAEIEGFFRESCSHVNNSQIEILPFAHFIKPIPYPPNLFLIGTVDSTQVHSSDADLLSNAAILDWMGMSGDSSGHSSFGPKFRSYESVFLQSRISNEYSAQSKLRKVFGWGMAELETLHRLESVLDDYGIQLAKQSRKQALIYLANSWTSGVYGLFHPVQTENLQIALDLVLSQILIPPIVDKVTPNKRLHRRISAEIAERFPRTLAYLNELERSKKNQRTGIHASY